MNACVKSQSLRSGLHRSAGSLRRSGRFPGLDSFSLVEVVFAIAIVSFALVSLLGMMALSSQLVHQADNYARLSNVSRQVLAGLDSKAYLVTSTNVAANATNYFTYDGLPTNSANGAIAYYQCILTNVTPAASTLTNLMQVQVIIRWPSPSYSNTNLINTSILNYD
jgi:Tfp pilus assembly protein PilV